MRSENWRMHLCSLIGSLKLAVVFLVGTREEIGDVGFSESFGGKVDEL
jgi:hypothetical protein